jgi:superfamily II DNA helicase RecQ
MISSIKKDLGILQCTDVIDDPNKTNISYHVKTVAGSLEVNFQWLIELIRRKGIETPRILIFFRQIKYMAELFEILETALGEAASLRLDEATGEENRLFDMYHMKTDQDVKDSICDSYTDPSCCVRVMLCSTSFSMGMNRKGVNHVIHYGPADDLDNYLQETGRAGRDPGSQSEATILKYKHSLGGRHITKQMKEFCSSKDCRRLQLLKPFKDNPESLLPPHQCCDNCSVTCRCMCTCGDSDCGCESVCPGFQSLVSAEMDKVAANRLDSDSDTSDSLTMADADYDSDSDSSIELRHRHPVLISDTDSD